MTWTVFCCALASSCLNVGWNLLSKLHARPRDLLPGIILATASLSIVGIPFTGLPPASSWPWIAAAGVFNVIHLRTLMTAYEKADFGIAYATVRAVIPPVLFVIGWVYFQQGARLGAVVGLILIAVSFFLFAPQNQNKTASHSRGLVYAVVAGLLLAFAVVFDVKGIECAGDGIVRLAGYGMASSLATSVGLLAILLWERRNPLIVLRQYAGICYGGAVLLFCSYLTGMWAYIHGPIGLVAPLRETGIVFGGALAVMVLRERVSRLQWGAMGLATVGVILVHVG